MTALWFIFMVICLLGFFFAITTDDGSYKAVFTIVAVVAFVIFSALLICDVEKSTSISHLNGKPIYEKQYLINGDGVIADSTYTKISYRKR